MSVLGSLDSPFVDPHPAPTGFAYGGSAGLVGVTSGTSSSSGAGEGDANSALAELDQGLRSGRLGDQGEAIVRFPRLFAKYPFPILINSALLKLADVFRQGPNFIKLCVLRVIQQSERHLDKITNVDEFVKRIFTVLHSNDPVARALTLRTLGAIAVIIPDRKQVHHNIRNALDSHDAVELHAAIFAASRFAARSKSFSVNMCSKISEMIRGFATPLDMKIKLVPIFQHMHHDAQTAQVVRQTCIEMLPSYPAEDFTCVILHTMTLLSAHTLVDLPDQVSLLLRYLDGDPRVAVKTRVVKDLKYLASAKHAHLWTESNISSMISFASSTSTSASSSPSVRDRHSILVSALDVLVDVLRASSSAPDRFALTNSGAPVLRLCESLCYSSDPEVAAGAVRLLCLLAADCKKEMHHVEGADILGDAIMAVEALFLLLSSDNRVTRHDVLKDCLRSVSTLCRVHQEACDQFVDIAGGMLLQVDSASDAARLLGELLASLANLKSGVLRPLIPDIHQTLLSVCERLSTCREDEREDLQRAALLLCVLLFQTFKDMMWMEEIRSSVLLCARSVDAWTRYRMARSACRYGHHALASELASSSSTHASSEQMYFWTRGLAKVFEGEMAACDHTNEDVVERATRANALILKGCTLIKAATSPYRSQEFQTRYLECRCSMLEALSQLLLYCNSLRTSPPPAVAGAQAKQTKDDLQRCGRITGLLRQSVQDFRSVGDSYGALYESCFDADPDSLAHVQLLQQLCSCMGQWIEMVCLKGNLQGSIYQDVGVEFGPILPKPTEEYTIEIQDMVAMGERVASQFQSLSPDSPPPISDAHTDILQRACTLVLSTPLCYPRFFFQQLQRTSLKLSVTPQPRQPGEPVGVSVSQQLAVKVEGVVASSTSGASQGEPWRTVEAVEVSMSAAFVAPPKSQQVKQGDESAPPSPSCEQRHLSQTATPHNDFFSAQFLVPFTAAGTHQLTVETALVDGEERRRWRGGNNGAATSVLMVKVFDDGQNRPSSAAAASGAASRR